MSNIPSDCCMHLYSFIKVHRFYYLGCTISFLGYTHPKTIIASSSFPLYRLKTISQRQISRELQDFHLYGSSGSDKTFILISRGELLYESDA